MDSKGAVIDSFVSGGRRWTAGVPMVIDPPLKVMLFRKGRHKDLKVDWDSP